MQCKSGLRGAPLRLSFSEVLPSVKRSHWLKPAGLESSPKFKTSDGWDLVIGSDGEVMRPDGHFVEPTILAGIESCSSSIKRAVLEDGGGEGAGKHSLNLRRERISHLWVLGTKSGQEPQHQKSQGRRKD